MEGVLVDNELKERKTPLSDGLIRKHKPRFLPLVQRRSIDHILLLWAQYRISWAYLIGLACSNLYTFFPAQLPFCSPINKAHSLLIRIMMGILQCVSLSVSLFPDNGRRLGRGRGRGGDCLCGITRVRCHSSKHQAGFLRLPGSNQGGKLKAALPSTYCK